MKQLAFGIAFAITPFTAALAEYPERPINYIVAFSTGGNADIGARTTARFLEACLGGKQPVVIINKPRAGGQIGFAEIASSSPDGYTIGTLNVPNIQVGAIAGPIDTLPGVPTMRDGGLDIISGATHAVGAPKGIPADVKAKLTDCFVSIAEDSAFQAGLKKLALLPATMDSEMTSKFVADEYAVMKKMWDTAPWE